MKRILVIGNSGAGKSVFSTKLEKIIDLPVIRLDTFMWRSATERTDEVTFIQNVENILAQPRWIMDGNYYKYLPIRLHRADTVIWLDFSVWVCAWRVLRRHVIDKCSKQKPLPKDGRYSLRLLQFIRFYWWVVWRFYRVNRPIMIEALKEVSNDTKIIILKNQAQVNQFLSSLA